MGISIKQVQAAKAARLNKPAPVIKIGGRSVLVNTEDVKAVPIETDVSELKLEAKKEQQPAGPNLEYQIGALENEMAVVMKERKILSTRTATLVEEITADLRNQSEALAEEFLKGNMPHPLLKDHAQRIEAKSEEIRKLYDQIEHLKKFGAPKVTPATTIDQSEEAKALKYEKRRLGDLICKTGKKITNANGGVKAPKNSDRMNAWRNTIAMAEARIIEIDMALKAMNNE
jgi:predicted  nucleic acid-binding Zn-ribbon protein